MPFDIRPMTDRPRRRMLCAAGGLLAVPLLDGCATSDPSRPTTAPDASVGGAGRRGPVLERSITGGWTGSRTDPLGRPAAGGPAARILLRQPVGVAARGVDLFIADLALQRIYRHNRDLDTLTPWVDLTGIAAAPSLPMAVAPDRSLLVADASRRRVLVFGPRGEPLRTLQDDANLGRPSGIAIDATGSVYVGDALYNHVVVFGPFGQPQSIVGARGSEPLRSVAGVAIADRALFVVDRVARAVVRFDLSIGSIGRYALGDGLLPVAIAAEDGGRTWVIDATRRAVHGHDPQGRAIADARLAAPALVEPVAIAADSGRLYVADMIGARVNVYATATLDAASRSG